MQVPRRHQTVWTLMMEKLTSLLDRIGIGPSDIVRTERISGLTNANYWVTTRDDELVVRIASAERAHAHGMSRDAEAQVLQSAQAAGLGVDILYYEFPDGHLVSRKMDAETYATAPGQFTTPEVFAGIVERVKRVHELPPVDHVFDPIAKAETTMVVAQENGIDLPEGTIFLLERARKIKERWGPLDPSSVVLCHNDLSSVNILQTSPPRLIDWEFVGMGDPVFDLATLLVACDDAHPLGLEHRKIALTTYFGKANSGRLKHLDDTIFLVRLHAAMWGVTQQVLRVPEPDGFTYTEYTAYMLNQLIAEV